MRRHSPDNGGRAADLFAMGEKASIRAAILGFTLIELLVVIVLIAIMTTITFPRLATLVGAYGIDGAARGLLINLQKTRFRAIAEGMCFQVTFDTVANTYTVLKKAGSVGCATGAYATDTAARKIDDSGSIRISNTPVNPQFDTRGGVVATSTIQLQGPNNANRAIFVQTAGRIYLQ